MLAPLLVAAAAIAAPAFAPVENQRYRYAIVETRFDGAAPYVFTAERTVVFRRDSAGWVATVTLTRIDAQAPAPIATMFRAGLQPMLERSILFRLDATGRLTDVDDADAVWAALAEGLGAAAGPAPSTGRAAGGATGARLLQAMPPERRRAMLLSILQPALAGSDAGLTPAPAHPVTVPGAGPRGAGALLSGERSVVRRSDGALAIHLAASGAVDAATHVTLTRDRLIDPVHGLVASEEETVDTVIGAGPTARRSRSQTSTTISPVP